MPYKDKFRNRKWSRERARELRTLALVKLGGKCSQCNYDDMRILHIDHVNRISKTTKDKYGHSFYKRIIDGKIDGLQLLCANCHQLKSLAEILVLDDSNVN